MAENSQALFWSTLGLSVGFGLGAGVIGGSLLKSANSAQLPVDLVAEEIRKKLIDGEDSGANFDHFPYYLNEPTRVLLVNAAYAHLKRNEFSKHTRNLSPASQTVFLTGPPGAEAYQEKLARALAHHFQAKLLIVDFAQMVSKVSIQRLATQVVLPQTQPAFVAKALSVCSSFLDNTAISKLSNEQQRSSLVEKTLLDAIFKVLASVSEATPTILYLQDVENSTLGGPKAFLKKLKQLTSPVLVLGSTIVNCQDGTESGTTSKHEGLFSYTIDIKPPENSKYVESWKSQLEEDVKAMQEQDKRNHISEILNANDVECDDLELLCFSETVLLSNHIEEIVASAISYYLSSTEERVYRSGKLVIPSKSIAYGLVLFKAGEMHEKPRASPITETKTEPAKPDEKKPADSKTPGKSEVPDNDFEKRIRPEVIPAGEIGVNFQDIGSLENVKESLQELVMLPLRRPELFKQGSLIKPCKGILLFGPPGTGKTMLAKAVATEAGASFINVSMSSITSKWFGEDEKTVRALFTLAAKVAPTIIFIDEVDSMLGQRSRTGEHEAMRKIKNEFMAHWDGLLSKGEDRILVLAATNRPFDLDEAIIRRFQRRIMVGLPNAQNRERILRTILSKEQLSDDFNFTDIANMTEGYSGSDLKNLCMAAAYRPVRELLKKEQDEKKKALENKTDSEASSGNAQKCAEQSDESPVGAEKSDATETCPVPEAALSFRPLNMSDIKEASKQVSASFASEGASMAELEQWNEMFGEGGSRKKKQLTYFI